MRRWALVVGLLGCVSGEDAFTDGRLEDRCEGAVPVCQFRAGCVLGDDEFVRGEFPGAHRLVVRTELPRSRVRVRLLLSETLFPGTEVLIQLWTPGCGALDRVDLVDVDFFARAGDDGVLEFTLDAPEKGDHMLEVFADMSAAYVLVADVLEPTL